MSIGGTGVGSPALPAQLRGPALVIAALAALTFALLTVRYSGGSMASPLDVRIDSALTVTGLSRHGDARYVVLFGEPLAVGFFSALLSLAAIIFRRWRLALLALLGPLLTGLTTTVVKPLSGRHIAGDNLTFPSGHAGAATALGLLTALLIISVLDLRRSGLIVLALGALIPGCVMSVALVVVGWHYPTDTIGGACAAVSVVLGSTLVTEFLADRLARPATASPVATE